VTAGLRAYFRSNLGGTWESALFEPLVPQRQPATVPVEDLDAIAATVAEDVEMSRERVLSDLVADELGKAVKALAHVGGLDGQEDPQRRGET
jgi:hypothetical protein